MLTMTEWFCISRVAELEHALQRVTEEMTAQKQEDTSQIENLRFSVNSFEEALNAERKENVNTRWE